MALPAGYEVSTDPQRIDIDLVHRYLSDQSYWARGRSRAIVERAIANSLSFSLFGPDGSQAGFARVVTDRATFGYLADVFIVPAAQGRGLGKAFVATILAHPDVAGLRRLMLITRDAHGLYARHGFTPSEPGKVMERLTAPLEQP